MFSTDDTIVAVATPPGRGGIGVVRVSGPEAVRIVRTLVARDTDFAPRHATFARVIEPGHATTGVAIDQVVVTWFAAPHSYTGDDVVEIAAHGSPVLLQRIVELTMASGARLAEPGEFTLRAYLNGRLDLVQAEAVADLVAAVTPLQARAAMDQLEGTLTGAIARIDGALFDVSARLEASLDFPEEGFHFITRAEAVEQVEAIRAELASLAAEGRVGRIVREGCLVAIVGRPNVGKSSVFNALVGSSRAIVTDVPGTTRDLLSERIDMAGLVVTLVDTAGQRDAGDAIEAEGVLRARQAQEIAALTLIVFDGSVPLTDDDRRVMAAATSGNHLAIVNKVDLPRAWDSTVLGAAAVVEVSAVTGAGMDRLRQRVVAAVIDDEPLRDTPGITNVRHLALIEDARVSIARAAAALDDGATEELVLVDLGAARRSIEEVTGRRTPDDLLKHVFAKFCVGK